MRDVTTTTIKIDADTGMLKDYKTEFGLTNAIHSLVTDSTFSELSLLAKERALQHVLDAIQEQRVLLDKRKAEAVDKGQTDGR